MILVGLGANLPGPYGPPQLACETAINMLISNGIAVADCSRWYRSAPVPVSDQPWFINGVVSVITKIPPHELLELMHRLEDHFGRIRQSRNESRVLDLDLLAYNDLIISATPNLPHPRLHERAFVLYPIRDLAPSWRHPVFRLSVDEMIARLPSDQLIEVS